MTEKILKPNFRGLRDAGGKVFWIWIAYQTIKGTLTTSLIWIPLIFMWLS
jgi:hypothetical protein